MHFFLRRLDDLRDMVGWMYEHLRPFAFFDFCFCVKDVFLMVLSRHLSGRYFERKFPRARVSYHLRVGVGGFTVLFPSCFAFIGLSVILNHEYL
jgi:hypothetical protein